MCISIANVIGSQENVFIFQTKRLKLFVCLFALYIDFSNNIAKWFLAFSYYMSSTIR